MTHEDEVRVAADALCRWFDRDQRGREGFSHAVLERAEQA